MGRARQTYFLLHYHLLTETPRHGRTATDCKHCRGRPRHLVCEEPPGDRGQAKRTIGAGRALGKDVRYAALPCNNIGLIMIQRVLPYEGLLHEVVEHNGVLYIGGIVPEDTSLDMSGQANDVLGQLDRLLKGLGSDLANVLQVTIFMTNLKEKAEFNAAWKAHFAQAHLPARAAIGVADLGPGVRLEMTAIAARPS